MREAEVREWLKRSRAIGVRSSCDTALVSIRWDCSKAPIRPAIARNASENCRRGENSAVSPGVTRKVDHG